MRRGLIVLLGAGIPALWCTMALAGTAERNVRQPAPLTGPVVEGGAGGAHAGPDESLYQRTLRDAYSRFRGVETREVLVSQAAIASRIDPAKKKQRKVPDGGEDSSDFFSPKGTHERGTAIGATVEYNTCGGTCSGTGTCSPPTCLGQGGVTCDSYPTCNNTSTCDNSVTCQGQQGATCAATECHSFLTCGGTTCIHPSPTCEGGTTCMGPGWPTCGWTCDGIPTCGDLPTCYHNPGCDPPPEPYLPFLPKSLLDLLRHICGPALSGAIGCALFGLGKRRKLLLPDAE